MDIPHDWDVVLDDLVATHLERRGLGVLHGSDQVVRLRKLLCASLFSDIQVELARVYERLLTQRLDSMDDFQIIQLMHDPDFDLVDLARLIQVIDPTAPPMVD